MHLGCQPDASSMYSVKDRYEPKRIARGSQGRAVPFHGGKALLAALNIAERRRRGAMHKTRRGSLLFDRWPLGSINERGDLQSARRIASSSPAMPTKVRGDAFEHARVAVETCDETAPHREVVVLKEIW